jgi:hypothetical protein
MKVKTIRICEICGKEFFVFGNFVAKYCSKKCKNRRNNFNLNEKG